MAKEDEEKMTFIISQGIFCSSKMLFGLKNAKVTYQCLVDKAFNKQIGRNLKVYVDDLVIKCCAKHEIIRGRHDPGLQGKHQGDKEAEAAFKQMKQLIAELPMLTAPMEKEELIVYLAAAQEAVKEDSSNTPMEGDEELSDPWTLFTDGSSYVDGSRAGQILRSSEGTKFTYALIFRFDAANNEAEYEALIVGLKIAKQIGVKKLQASVDLRLVANQINGSYIAKEPVMILYLEKVKTLSDSFKKFSIKQVPKSENKKADALNKIVSISFARLTKQVLVEELREKSINVTEVLAVVEEERDTWITPIYNYLTEEKLPAEKEKVRAVRRKSQRFAVINGVFYKNLFLDLSYIRSVVSKALGTGYYWPTMHKDAKTLIKACQDCQVHRPVLRNPQQKLTPITSPWPFYKWGINIPESFPKGPAKVKFLIVAVDYFTKWIKAKPVATITDNQVKKFVWDNIVCRFGLPREIIADNGK
ncbi:reverse transcriptase domain-containing protein [Tanacetum coccineum]